MTSAEKQGVSKIETIELPKKIRGLRYGLGLTQEQFAAKVGVTFSTANRWESGKSRPSQLALHRIEELMERISEE